MVVFVNEQIFVYKIKSFIVIATDSLIASVANVLLIIDTM